jgi:hypothetical protein
MQDLFFGFFAVVVFSRTEGHWLDKKELGNGRGRYMVRQKRQSSKWQLWKLIPLKLSTPELALGG